MDNNNYIDEARPKNGPGKLIREPHMRAKIEKAEGFQTGSQVGYMSMFGEKLRTPRQKRCPSVVYNPRGIALSDIRKMVPITFEFFQLRVPSCTSLASMVAMVPFHN